MATKLDKMATGLYLKSPHGTLIADGKKTSIACVKLDNSIPGERVIISKEDGKGLAFGVATISEPIAVPHDTFNQHFDSHRVTVAECAKWWPNAAYIYEYPITNFTPFTPPREVQVPAGVQMLMEVEYIDERAIAQEEPVMPWKPSDAQGHTREADTPEKQRQWAEVANSALAACLKDGKEQDKCEASAIQQANAVVGKRKEADERLTAVQQLAAQMGVKITVPSESDVATPSGTSEPECKCNSDTNPDALKQELTALNSLIDAALKAAEPDQTTCTCPNCGAKVDHEDDIPCRDVKCPDCGSMCRGGGDDAEDAGDKANPAVQALAGMLEPTPEVAPVPAPVAPAELVAPASEPAPIPEAKEEPIVALGTTQPMAEPLTVPTAPPVAPTPVTPDPTHSDTFNLLSLLSRAKAAITSFLGLNHPETLPAFKTFTTKDGKTYLVLWTTNNYRDRDGEIFSLKSLQEYVARKATEPVKGEFWYAHVPGSKFGTVLWQDVVADRFLVQVGTFDTTPIGDAFKSFFTKYPSTHKQIAPHGWGASHGYRYLPEDRTDRVYNWFDTFESSVLPMHRAANIHNPQPIILGDKQMDTQSLSELRAISTEIGVDLESMVIHTAEQRKSELDDKVDHKSTDAVQPDAQTPTPAPADAMPVVASAEPIAPVSEQKSEQASLTDAQLTTIAEKLATAFGLQRLSDTLAGLQNALTKQQGEVAALQQHAVELKEADEKRLAEKAQSLPNFESFSWLQPSRSPLTLMAPDDKLKSAGPKRVPEAIARLTSEQT